VFAVLPLASGQVYCYASAPAPPGLRHDNEAAELKRRFGRWHDPIPGLMLRQMDPLASWTPPAQASAS
jgi:hypothetical protein